MPRNYTRKKPEITPITEQVINSARKLIQQGKSIRSVAMEFGVSESGLRNRFKLNSAATSLGRCRIFNDEQEAGFVRHCKALDEELLGFTLNHLRRLAYDYATANNIYNRFDQSTKMAGRDWVKGFLKRYPQLLFFRKLTPTNNSRIVGFNQIPDNAYVKEDNQNTDNPEIDMQDSKLPLRETNETISINDTNEVKQERDEEKLQFESLTINTFVEDEDGTKSLLEPSTIKSEKDQDNTVRDSADAFCEYVALKLKKYPENLKCIVQHKISHILFQADMGELNLVPSNPVESPTDHEDPILIEVCKLSPVSYHSDTEDHT